MQTESSKPRPSIASALQRVLRDVEPERVLPVEGEAEAARKPSGYFDPGDYAAERDWWEMQLARRGEPAPAG